MARVIFSHLYLEAGNICHWIRVIMNSSCFRYDTYEKGLGKGVKDLGPR